MSEHLQNASLGLSPPISRLSNVKGRLIAL